MKSKQEILDLFEARARFDDWISIDNWKVKDAKEEFSEIKIKASKNGFGVWVEFFKKDVEIVRKIMSKFSTDYTIGSDKKKEEDREKKRQNSLPEVDDKLKGTYTIWSKGGTIQTVIVKTRGTEPLELESGINQLSFALKGIYILTYNGNAGYATQHMSRYYPKLKRA